MYSLLLSFVLLGFALTLFNLCCILLWTKYTQTLKWQSLSNINDLTVLQNNWIIILLVYLILLFFTGKMQVIQPTYVIFSSEQAYTFVGGGAHRDKQWETSVLQRGWLCLGASST